MRLLTTLVLFLMFGCAVSGYSQAKVGTSGAQFLNISPSVRANGMGQVGAAVVEHGSFYFNPGSVALLADRDYIFLSMYPTHTELSPRSSSSPQLGFSSVSAGISSRLRPFHIGAAYYRTRMSASIEETTYDQGGGTGRFYTYKDVANSFVIGGAYSGILRIGFGVAFKQITESSNDNRAESNAFDFGFLIQGSQESRLGSTAQETEWKLVTIPSLGLAWSNYGGELRFGKNEYSLPKTSRVGLSLELALDRQETTRRWRCLSFLFAIDIVEPHEEGTESRTNYGIQLGLFEAAALRLGLADPNEMTTYGLTVSSFGIARVFTELLDKGSAGSASMERLFSEHLGFEYSFAHYEKDNPQLFAGAEFHELSMTWRF